MRRRAALLILFAAFTFSCGAPADPEVRLRFLLEETERAIEARDLGPVKDAIAETYTDDLGHEKREIVRYLAGLVLRNQNIHMMTRIRELSVDRAGVGNVTLVAALASGPITSVDDLAGLRADIYRFDFRFDDVDGDWLLSHARWRRVTAADLFP